MCRMRTTYWVPTPTLQTLQYKICLVECHRCIAEIALPLSVCMNVVMCKQQVLVASKSTASIEGNTSSHWLTNSFSYCLAHLLSQQSLTHMLASSLACWLAGSLPHSLKSRTHSPHSCTHSLTHLPTHTRTHSLMHALTQITHSITHSLTHSLTRSLTHSVTQPPTHSLSQPFALVRLPTKSTHIPTHPPAHLLSRSAHCC